MNAPYSVLASYYDRLNRSVDYPRWAEGIASLLKAERVLPGALVLDLGCGTGNVTLPLAEIGYDMIGVDLSPEMLTEAKRKDPEGHVLFLCQDMCDFELYGTVSAVVSCLDSVNYLTDSGDLFTCFSLVHNYLDPDGLFLFDVNTPYKFEHVYDQNSYVLEADKVFCVWQNRFRRYCSLCDFDLTIFAEDKDGRYRRYEERQTERCYSLSTIRRTLKKTGFELLSVGEDLAMSPLNQTSERAFFLCRAKK